MRSGCSFLSRPLIEEALYDAVQEQLAENRRRARQSQRGARYLLQGLLVCKVCGYAYYGKPLSPSARKHRPRAYAYYRCVGTDSYRFGGHRVCANTQMRTDLVEIAVWQEVCQLLKDPQRLEREYHRRGHARPRGAKWETPESLRAQISKLQRGMARLIDGYAEGLIEKVEFEPRIKRMKQRVTVLEEQLQQLADEAVQQRELRLLIGQLEEFVTKVQRNLATADWEMKREIIRALVRRVEIDKQEVTVVFRVGPDPSGQSPEKKSSQHCWRRAYCPMWYKQGRVNAFNAVVVSPQRKHLALYAQFHRRTLRGEEVVGFLKPLLRHLRGPVVLLWDRGPIHHRQLVQEFLHRYPRVHAEYFPAYSPNSIRRSTYRTGLMMLLPTGPPKTNRNSPDTFAPPCAN